MLSLAVASWLFVSAAPSTAATALGVSVAVWYPLLTADDEPHSSLSFVDKGTSILGAPYGLALSYERTWASTTLEARALVDRVAMASSANVTDCLGANPSCHRYHEDYRETTLGWRLGTFIDYRIRWLRIGAGGEGAFEHVTTEYRLNKRTTNVGSDEAWVVAPAARLSFGQALRGTLEFGHHFRLARYTVDRNFLRLWVGYYFPG